MRRFPAPENAEDDNGDPRHMGGGAAAAVVAPWRVNPARMSKPVRLSAAVTSHRSSMDFARPAPPRADARAQA